VRAVQESVRHEEGMPGSLMEQLSEANSLLTTLPQELEERGKYLETNQQLRLDYAALKENLYAWVKEADAKLQGGKLGVDFESVLRELEEHKVSIQKVIHKFCLFSCASYKIAIIALQENIMSLTERNYKYLFCLYYPCKSPV
jgi:hypothetical protein